MRQTPTHDAAPVRRRLTRLLAACGIVAPLLVVGVTLTWNDSATGPASAAPRPAVRDAIEPAAKPRAETPLIEIAATGDIAMGSTPELPMDDARSLFAGVEHELRGDLVLGNLETALTDTDSSKCAPASSDCFSFRAPPAYAERLSGAGFTMLNLANNHSFDYGADGHVETIAALEEARLRHTGRPSEIAYQRAGPVRIAVLGFAPYPWAQNLLDLDAASRLVRRADAVADVVVVTMHAGAEGNAATQTPRTPELYRGEPRGDSRAFAHAVVDAGADLVVGHGPHVLRGLEWYRGRLVAHSLGNFASYRNFALAGASGVSGILQVSLDRHGRWRDGRLVAVQLVGDGTPELDASRAGVGAIRALSQSDFGVNAMRVATDGELSPPAAR